MPRNHLDRTGRLLPERGLFCVQAQFHYLTISPTISTSSAPEALGVSVIRSIRLRMLSPVWGWVAGLASTTPKPGAPAGVGCYRSAGQQRALTVGRGERWIGAHPRRTSGPRQACRTTGGEPMSAMRTITGTTTTSASVLRAPRKPSATGSTDGVARPPTLAGVAAPGPRPCRLGQAGPVHFEQE
jgi:hypothetical protein